MQNNSNFPPLSSDEIDSFEDEKTVDIGLPAGIRERAETIFLKKNDELSEAYTHLKPVG